MTDRPPQNKPWAVLRVSRRQYYTERPWKRAGMTRARFEDLIAILPDGFVDECHRAADAEKLAKALFGE